MNANFDAVEAALENTLSRDGTSPNQMGAVIDMNSNKIINLAAPTSGSDAARLTDVLAISPGTGVNTFLVTPTSANLAAALTDETGTGLAVFNTSPALTTPVVTGGTVTGATITGGTVSGLATDLAVADGGTGASTAGDALTNLGVSAFNQTLLGTANQAAFLAAFGQIDNVETDFVQAGTGAVTITTQAKLRQASVQPNSGEFGAFTTPTISTATLLAAFTHAMAAGRVVELAGAYTIDGPITPTTAVDGAELRIFLRDDVTITVDSGATAFDKVFYAESTTPISHAISGNGTLTLDCNNKAAAGIWLRHTSSTIGGNIALNTHVHVKNVKAATGITNAVGIAVFGRYERIIMRSPTVEDVTRVDAVGECSGITCSGFGGEVELHNPVVRRVNYGTLGSGDADCIKCFGVNLGSGNNRREGSVRIFNPVMEDGQTRLYKDQCGDTVIYRPWCRRRAVDGTPATITGSGSVDFDFQYGGGLVLDAHFEYYKSATSVSPFGGTHSMFAFQQLVNNSEMYAAARNSTLITDVAFTRAAQVAEGGSRSTTDIAGLKVIPVSGLSTTVFTDAVVEIDLSQILAKTTETIINVTDVDAPNTNPIVGYRGYSTLDGGTATAGAATTLTDSGKSWTTNVYAGFLVSITSGTGAGQSRLVASNTGTVLTVTGAWTTNPDATSVYTIAYSATSKLSIRVDRCSTSLAVTGDTTRAFSDLAGNILRSLKSFELGDNPGYRNWYRKMDIPLKKLRAGTKLSLYLDECTFVDSDYSTPVSVPWGTTGTLFLECKGLTNFGTTANDTILEARLNNATVSPSAWHTQYGGVTFGALN